MRRRRFLGAAGAGLTGALAGCTSLVQTTSSRAPPLAENRPDASYVPTHMEGMKLADVGSVGDLNVGLMYSYAHRFWVIENEGGEYVAKLVDIESDDAVHLMATPWDPETGLVIPDTGLSVEITRDGDLVSEEVIYPMVSQIMGFHYGANFSLDGDGTYTVTVSVGGVSFDRYGSFEGKFGEPASADIEFDYSERRRNEIPYRIFDERVGEPGALDTMGMDVVPIGHAPQSLPGASLGSARSGDAVFLASVVERDDLGGTPYLAVSPRTPHNELVLPGMALSATVERGGTTVFDDSLATAMHPELGYHFGAPVEGLSASDTVRLSVDVPPQVARHEGYETAFLDMEPMQF